MPRLTPALLLAAVAAAARAEPPPEVVALQKAAHRLIDAAKPSVACILVSRSDKYAELGEGPTPGAPGQLGEFNPGGRVRFGPAARKDLIKRLDLANPETVPEAYGSGVVIDNRDLVLTNFHVIDRATKVFVRLPGTNRGSYANIVAGDPRADLAVLKMIHPPADLKALPFGDGGKVRQGDFVVGLANPFAAGDRDGNPSASWGMVSNVRRPAPPPGGSDEVKRVKALAQYAFLLQTDVRLNRGCSGGALLNLDGELIGLTTALAAVTGGDEPGGYAIPIDANVKKMIEVLKKGEEIEYGFLGVQVNPELRGDGQGVPVLDVSPGMPAQRAGIMSGDLVTAINGNPIRDQEDLFLQISAALAGSEAEVEVRRGLGTQTFRVRLAKSAPSEPAPIVSSRPRGVFGLRVDYVSTLPSDANPPEGVLVKDLEPGTEADKKLKGWADRARLIVTAVDGKPVPTPADFYRAANGKASVTLDVVEASRDGARKRVTLP
jgi:serine protease Do